MVFNSGKHSVVLVGRAANRGGVGISAEGAVVGYLADARPPKRSSWPLRGRAGSSAKPETLPDCAVRVPF